MDDVWVAIDLETTGLSPETDEIIEVGAVKFQGARVLDTFQSFARPERPISRFIQGLTGIEQGDLDRAPDVRRRGRETGRIRRQYGPRRPQSQIRPGISRAQRPAHSRAPVRHVGAGLRAPAGAWRVLARRAGAHDGYHARESAPRGRGRDGHEGPLPPAFGGAGEAGPVRARRDEAPGGAVGLGAGPPAAPGRGRPGAEGGERRRPAVGAGAGDRRPGHAGAGRAA